MSEWSENYCLELDEEEVKICENSFANKACCWVAYEVKKASGEKVGILGCVYQGSHFTILEPKTFDYPISIYILFRKRK